MRTLVIWMELTEECLEVLDEITLTYMTFLDWTDDGYLSITARQEDMAAIERALAEFV